MGEPGRRAWWKKKRRWAVVLAAWVVLYAAGFGPANRLYYYPQRGFPTGGAADWLRWAVKRAYDPVGWFARSAPKPVADAIDQYFYLWMPDR